MQESEITDKEKKDQIVMETEQERKEKAILKAARSTMDRRLQERKEVLDKLEGQNQDLLMELGQLIMGNKELKVANNQLDS